MASMAARTCRRSGSKPSSGVPTVTTATSLSATAATSLVARSFPAACARAMSSASRGSLKRDRPTLVASTRLASGSMPVT